MRYRWSRQSDCPWQCRPQIDAKDRLDQRHDERQCGADDAPGAHLPAKRSAAP